jgi:PAS domain S-box-containing protein
MKTALRLIALLISLSGVTSAPALDPQKAITQFSHTAWSAKDGIPGPVRAIAQTPDGYLWLGTEAGLYRFDGLRFVPWESRFHERLAGPSVWSLLTARDGSLWIGFSSSGIGNLRDGHLKNYSPNDGAPSGGVLSIAEDANGRIWAGGQYGFSKFDRGEWHRVGEESGYPARGAQALYVDSLGTLWAATDGLAFGLSDNPVLRNTIFTLAPNHERFEPTGQAVGMVWSMSGGPDGNVWIADTSGHAARSLVARGANPAVAVGDEPLCLLFDDNRTLWVGLIERGLRRTTGPAELESSGLEQLQASDGLSGGMIYSAFKDREGNVWFGTAGGLDRFRENKVTPFSEGEGLEPDQQIALTSTPDGSVWIVSYTRDSVRRFRNGTFLTSKLPPFSDSDSARILSLATDGNSVWVGGNFKLAHETNGEFAYSQHLDVEKGSNVEAIAHDATGALWISISEWWQSIPESSAKIMRFNGGQWTDFSTRTDLPRFRSRAIYGDPQGRVWLGFENGEVAVYEDDKFRVYSAADGLRSGRILSITSDSAGNIWVGGEGGLSRFQQGRFVTLTAKQGLAGNSISGIIEDDEGFLWLACALGIFRVSPQEMEKSLASPSYIMQGTTLTAADGLRGLPRQREPFPTATRAADGRLWFATTGGIAVIDPRHLPRNLIPPPVTIEAIKADEQLLPATSGMRLPPKTKEVEIEYAGISLTDPGRVQFRHKLEGYDDHWRGPVATRHIRYTNLPPGQYRFQVVASNNDGVWNETGASWSFSMEPAFYQTIWFRLASFGVVAGFFVVLYKIRLRRITRHNTALRQEITERKRTEALLAGEKRLLEMIATGVPLGNILEVLCQIIEEQSSGTLASVLLLSLDGIHLDSAAGPSLPEGWIRQMASLAIGPCAGSCGTAAYRGSAVIVSDIATDPLWDVPEHRAAALSYGLRASWSNPILSSKGKVLGTFCMYYRETKSPDRDDLELIELATYLARVAIERDRAEEALRRSEGFLADGQRISHTGSWSWNVSSGKLAWSEEHFRIFGFDPEKTEPSFQLFLETVHPEDRPFIERGLDEAVREKSGFDMEFRIALADGSIKNVQGVGRPILTHSGDISHYIGTTVDITARKHAEALLAGEKRLLEMVARGDLLARILDALCRLVEELSSGALSSILLLEPNGNRLHHGAAPNLPKVYVDAIDGSVIGPSAGSCGTAAYRAKPVIVSDIATDPLWADYRDVALPHGLRACWSSPILSSDGRVLGTFAIYYREPRSPTPQQLEIIEHITHLASIALERKRAEEALRASEQVARGQVEALVQSLDILATAPPAEKFIGQMLSTIGRLLKAQSVILWLIDEATDSMVWRAGAHGANLAAVENGHPFVIDPMSWKENEGLQEMVFTGVPQACEDIETDPRISKALRRYFRSNGTKKFLTIPTIVGSRVNGFIGIRHEDRPSYRPEEIELAQALAHQAMFAIQLNEFAEQGQRAAVLDERNRMARDIHDNLAQGLTGVIVQLQAAEDATSKGYKKAAQSHLENARNLARHGLSEARRSVRALRPQALEEATFWEAFESLIKNAAVGTSLQTEFQVRGEMRELPPLAQENLLHIGQEALTNTLKYAHATRFETRLSFSAKEIRLELQDNGTGFKTNGRHDGFGLTGMRERVEQMGGSLTIASARGKGTRIVVVLPRDSS